MADKDYFTKAFHWYLHDVPTDLGNTNNDYYYAFLKSFAFFKFYLLFFLLLIIGFINLSNKKPVDEEMKNNPGYWVLEYFLLFLAFFIPCIIMYLIRDPANTNFFRDKNKGFFKMSMIKTIITLLFMCFIKHLDFQLSGLYRWKFSSKKCLKYKEHFKQEQDKDKEEEETKCKCDDSVFDGPFWNGLGRYGLVFTGILIIIFLFNLVYPSTLNRLFGIEDFYQEYTFLCLCLILVTFIIGFITINKFKNNKCNNNSFIDMLYDGGACVTIAFTSIITFLPLYILIKWNRECSTTSCPSLNSNLKYSNNNEKGKITRAFIVFVEILVTYFIFTIMEAIIESFRKEEDLSHIFKNKDFWINSLTTLLGVAYIQIILEYSGWFHQHLFKVSHEKST